MQRGRRPLILSEKNTAAKLLSRPGEAIYNDANGLAEGNHFFQVVWLSDERREAYLKQLRDLARERPPVLARTPIVFEGDAPADLARNPRSRALLDAPTWPASPRSAQAWVGDPVAIKEPTVGPLPPPGREPPADRRPERRGGAGRDGLGPARPGRAVSAGRVGHGPRRGPLRPSSTARPRTSPAPTTSPAWPVPCRIPSSRRRLARRGAGRSPSWRRRSSGGSSPTADGPEIFLFIHDLARFRDLRRREDDFGFSRRDEDAGPADHLQTILREGPGLGVHVVIWCDNVSNLNRSFDQQLIREFEMRVLFQMSQTDSGHLLDAPHASKLGPNRALFFSEEQNRLEKFRPYGRPPAEWLSHVHERLASRGAPSGTRA